jgi:hypothetical protein
VRFEARSATVASPVEDITTWDLPRIDAEIDTHFVRALADRATLRRIPQIECRYAPESGDHSESLAIEVR